MKAAVGSGEIKQILNAAKTQFIDVAIYNSEREWSDEYYHILNVNEFRNGVDRVLTLVLCDSKSRCFAVDVQDIHGLKFNKYLQLDEGLIQEIRITSDKTILQVCHELLQD